jgi:hypothetical protein
MSDYLGYAVARSVSNEVGVRPRPLSLFEPPRANAPPAPIVDEPVFDDRPSARIRVNSTTEICQVEDTVQHPLKPEFPPTSLPVLNTGPKINADTSESVEVPDRTEYKRRLPVVTADERNGARTMHNLPPTDRGKLTDFGAMITRVVPNNSLTSAASQPKPSGLLSPVVDGRTYLPSAEAKPPVVIPPSAPATVVKSSIETSTGQKTRALQKANSAEPSTVAALPARPRRDSRESIATQTPVPVIRPLQTPTQPRNARSSPTINVTIGRVEVKAVPPAPAEPRRSRAAASLMNLDEYLRRRREERHL